MAAANSFSPVLSNDFTRKWGGSQPSAVDPYLNGYFFTHWAYIPSQLAMNHQHTSGKQGALTNGEIQKLLSAACLSVTIPGATLNKAEFTGLGGVKWAVPTNLDWDNTLTCKFLEFSTLPIYGVIHSWVRMIRDYRSGITTMGGSPGSPNSFGEGGDNTHYTKSDYSASMYYWTTKPDGVTVEYYGLATGMFPMKDPADQFSGDLSAVDKLEMDIDFNTDYLWHEPWVLDRCQNLATAHHSRGEHSGPQNVYGTEEPGSGY